VRHRLTVAEGAAVERLDVYLAAKLAISRSQVQKLIDAGSVKVNGDAEKARYLVESGDEIVAELPEPRAYTAPPPNPPVVYEDEDIIVVDKPAGLAAHHGSGTEEESTVADFAREHTTDPDPDRPGIVHRLDRDTSGLLVLAKTADAKAFMQRQFAGRTVHKTYVALVVGRIEPAEAIVRLPLDRDPARPLRRAVVTTGREAVTRYRTTATYPGYTLVEANPETGRTHQIRVHFATLGHPVAGDTVYGPPQRPLGLTRQFLHAISLEFTAPSGQTVKFTSELPTELAQVLRKLEIAG
jgi:23S rRNA pseudouridine1911/1915/1917 synthase